MKILSTVFLCFIITTFSFAQIQGEDEVYLSGDIINPVFNNGGIEKFYEFVNKEFDYTKVTKLGKMTAAFNITKEGDLKNIRLLNFTEIDAATEMIRVIKTSPKWKPATSNGKPVTVKINFPYEFKLKENPILKTDEIPVSFDSTDSADVVRKNSSGGQKFRDFIAKNYVMPDVPGLKGKVVVSFTINEDGSLSDFKTVYDLGYGTVKEAIRVLKLSSGKWTPAVKDGKKVKTTYTVPIIIRVQED